MLHETKANNQTQRNGSPTGDRKSTWQVERNVPQRFLNRCFSIGSSYHCILVVLIVPFSSSAPRRCSQPFSRLLGASVAQKAPPQRKVIRTTVGELIAPFGLSV